MKKKVLLVEDDADDAEMTMYVLGKLQSFDFIHIDDGERAIEYLNDPFTEKPALILLDIKMPRVSGIDVLRAISAHRNEIPVLAFISSKEGKRYVESFDVRADEYLLKPVDCKSFVTTLTAIGMSRLIASPART